MKSDIEIARNQKMYSIDKIASSLDIKDEYLEMYGKYKGKISLDVLNESNRSKDSKLILVTSINPTPYGEGKTTLSIGIHDALSLLKKKSIAVLREPSLGPVFGIKGGATGGGYSQVVPMEDINLHFTGDIHAITCANNLMCAIVDNHIFQGNELSLDINNIYIKRCLDINDRALRSVTLRDGRKDTFQITTASEIMAILCLSSNLENLKERLNRILVGKNLSGNPVYLKQFNCTDSMAIILKEAIKPNLVQTLEHNPVIIHGGPFANIAHGCNSLIATNMGLKLCDYVITEAGFGSDLGGFKFLDIKSRLLKKLPDVIVINVTVRAIKHNGEGSLQEGFKNLQIHIENMRKYSDNVMVCLNRFQDDEEEDINCLQEFVEKFGCSFQISTAYIEGRKGALAVAEEIIRLTEKSTEYLELYSLKQPIKEKIEIICKDIFRASSIEYTDKANSKIHDIENINLTELPICIAKTPYSLSDDSKKLGAPKNMTMTITDLQVSSGAGFIIVYMGNIMTMPGLGKNSSYLHMKIDNEGNIFGLS